MSSTRLLSFSASWVPPGSRLFWLQGAAPFLGGGFGHFYNYAPVKIEYAIEICRP
jgi:hypothetical protein